MQPTLRSGTTERVEPSVTILTPAGSDVGALWWPPHALGHLWSLRSLLLLGVYTVVFGYVFGARPGKVRLR